MYSSQYRHKNSHIVRHYSQHYITVISCIVSKTHIVLYCNQLTNRAFFLTASGSTKGRTCLRPTAGRPTCGTRQRVRPWGEWCGTRCLILMLDMHTHIYIYIYGERLEASTKEADFKKSTTVLDILQSSGSTYTQQSWHSPRRSKEPRIISQIICLYSIYTVLSQDSPVSPTLSVG